MGADGGVVWVNLREGASREALQRLLAPWWWQLTRLGSRTYEDSRVEWLREHAHEHPHAVFGGYGTDLCDLLGWGDLGAWLHELDDALTDPARGLPDGATFGDLCDEIATRPAGWWSSGDRCGPVGATWEAELTGPEAEHLRGQLIDAWLAAVRALLDGDTVHSVETWT